MRKLFRDIPEIKESLKKTMENNDIEGFNMILDSLLVQDAPKQKEKLEDFKQLINNVWEGITDWRERNKPKPEEARGLGVIEPNVGHTIARRFKIGAPRGHRGAQ